MSSRPRIEIKQTQRLALNQRLQASIELLRADAAGLTRYLEEQAIDNPHLRLEAVTPLLGDWLPRWTSVLTGGGGGAEDVANAAPGLIAHMMSEIEGLSLSPRSRRIALALVEALEPSGWLGQPLAEVARDIGASVPEVELVLQRLQTLDPPGIFARNLAECLEIQARDADVLDAPMVAMLANLSLLASGDTARLARLCGTDEAGVRARFRIIRAMNPKPGADFSAGRSTALREPDLLARQRENGGWVISLNRSALPSVEIAVDGGNGAGSLGQARALAQLVQARNATLLAVGAEIANRQARALSEGPSGLVPLRMADLAVALNLHESTISRAVAGTSLDTPRGTWWLRQMFSVGLGEDGKVVAGAALRQMLANLIRQEDPAHPLSDQALASALESQTGVPLARRTAAKYREMQGLPPAHRRRRVPR